MEKDYGCLERATEHVKPVRAFFMDRVRRDADTKEPYIFHYPTGGLQETLLKRGYIVAAKIQRPGGWSSDTVELTSKGIQAFNDIEGSLLMLLEGIPLEKRPKHYVGETPRGHTRSVYMGEEFEAWYEGDAKNERWHSNAYFATKGELPDSIVKKGARVEERNIERILPSEISEERVHPTEFVFEDRYGHSHIQVKLNPDGYYHCVRFSNGTKVDASFFDHIVSLHGPDLRFFNESATANVAVTNAERELVAVIMPINSK